MVDAASTTGRYDERTSVSQSDYHVKHDPESAANLSTTVIHALADVMGVETTDTGFALYDSVDPDALDRIFASTADGLSRAPGHVAFIVSGYRVTVYSDGEIVISPPADRPGDVSADRPS